MRRHKVPSVPASPLAVGTAAQNSRGAPPSEDCIGKHCEVLEDIEKMPSVSRGAKYYEALFDTFSIEGDTFKDKKYNAFYPTNFEYILRWEHVESEASRSS
jgi:nicotinamidase-related amidase